jgi:hypothetical protein
MFQNILLFTTSLPLVDRLDKTWGKISYRLTVYFYLITVLYLCTVPYVLVLWSRNDFLLFSIYGHQTPRFGSGSVFSLKGWIRIKLIRIRDTSSLCRELRVLRGPEPALGLQLGVQPLRARHLSRLEWGRYHLPYILYFYTVPLFGF